MLEAQIELYNFMKVKPTSVIALEIGGGNGLQGMILGASNMMNIPTVDGDWMGRAYPVAWQTTPVVFEEKPVFLPSTICDGNGQVMFMTRAKSELMVERAFRAALSQMGSHVGCAKGPISGKNTRSWVVEHTISLSWRIGRAVALSRSLNQIDTVAESIISEVGGDESAKVLFKGKIVGVDRTLRMGHVYGEVIIEGMNLKGEGGSEFRGKLTIPFKNENIVAIREEENGSETVCTTSIIRCPWQSSALTWCRSSPPSPTSYVLSTPRMARRLELLNTGMVFWSSSWASSHLRSGHRLLVGLR